MPRKFGEMGKCQMPQGVQFPLGTVYFRPSEEPITFDHIRERLNNLPWKIRPGATGEGRIAFAVLSRDKATGEIWVAAMLENATAPRHRHKSGGAYGEMILTIAGELEDVTDGNMLVTLTPGMIQFHGADTIHAPRADFWFGLYHQPAGSAQV